MPDRQDIGDPTPPQEPREEIARRILMEHGISARGGRRLAVSLSESGSDVYVRGLLSIQRPPGYESDLDILAKYSPGLAAKAHLEPHIPDFTTQSELDFATRSLHHLETDAEGDLTWMNRQYWDEALRRFTRLQNTQPFIKSLLSGNESEMVRNAQVAFLLGALTVGGYRSAYLRDNKYDVLNKVYPKLKVVARDIAEHVGSLPELAKNFVSNAGDEMYHAAQQLFEHVDYEDGFRAPIHISNDIVLEAFPIFKKPEVFESAVKEFYKETLGLDVDEGARFLRENLP